jgi:hypothetical protein
VAKSKIEVAFPPPNDSIAPSDQQSKKNNACNMPKKFGRAAVVVLCFYRRLADPFIDC